jgi:small subunit ribosomal protein S20
MANIKSQIKRNRQNEADRARNKSVRSRLKTLTRSFTESLESGDEGAQREAYRAAVKGYDQAAAKGVIHSNKAANAKSRLAKRLNSSG